MNGKHTPGPWGAISEAWYLNGLPTVGAQDGKGLVLAHVEHDGKGNYAGQLGDPLADARLMAAAPDLLAVLQELHNLLNEYEPVWYLVKHDKHAKAAIAKAQGGQA